MTMKMAAKLSILALGALGAAVGLALPVMASDVCWTALPDDAVCFTPYGPYLDGADSYAASDLNGVPDGQYAVSNSPPRYRAWCFQACNYDLESGVQRCGSILRKTTGLLPAYLQANPVVIPGLCPDSGQTIPWGKINYLLNHKGDAIPQDVQAAIWFLTDGAVTDGNLAFTDSLSAGAQDLIADTNGKDGYVPGAGNVVAVIPDAGPDSPYQRVLIEVDVQIVVDLGITISAAPDPVVVGNNLIYSLVVTNAGACAAPSVTVTDTLTASVTYFSSSASQGSCVINGSGQLICSLGDIDANSSATITVTVVPTTEGLITNQATASSSGYDSNTSDNVATALTTVIAQTRIIGLSGNLAFGGVITGQTATATLTITNIGNSTLTVSSISYPSGFSGDWSGTVAAGASTNVTVSFAPLLAQDYSGTVTVNSDATSGTSTMAASGTGLAPAQLVVVPATNDFGELVIGQTSNLAFEVSNSGSVTLSGTASLVTGGSPFGIVSGASFTVAGGGSTNVVVGFSPVAAGAFGNQVVFDSNGGTRTNEVLGTGLSLAQLAVSPATNNFGSVVIGQSSNLAFQVSNTGSVTLSGTASLESGGSPFGIVSGTPFTVAGGSATNVVIGFSPVAAGAFGNQVVFAGNGGTRTNSVLGTGLASAQLAVSPATNNYGSVVIGQSSNLAFQVSNSGSVTLNGTASLVTGGSPFGIVSGASFTVAGGSSTNVVVGFSPLAAGAFGNQVVFDSNGGTRTNSVLGTGLASAQLAVSPATNNYGSVVIGQSSNLAFQVSNSGSVTLSGTASLVTGGSPFGIVSGASFTVAGGGSTNVVVGFSPLAAGAFGNQVVFDSNGGTRTNSVLGTGLALAQLAVSPATNNFGSVVIGQSSNLAFQVSNTGSVTLSGTASLESGGSPFGIVSGTPFTVAGGSATNVVVGFSPLAAGAFGNQVVFDSNGGSRTNSVLGTGLALAQLAVSPATNSFGSVVVGQSSNLAFQVSNTGSVTLSGTASLVTGGSPFGFVSGASFTVAGGSSTNVVVGFSPLAAGAFGNQVVFDSNGGTRTNSVLGTGLALAQLVVSPATNNFGSVVIGQSSNLAFQVSNTGSVTLSGTASLESGGSPFGIVSGTPFTVAGGSATNVVVGFSPLAAGAFGNQVVFDSNGGTRTNSVLGTGLALAQLVVSPATNNFGSVVIGQSSNLAFQVSNSGSVTLNGTASLVTGGSPFGIVSGASFTVAAGGTTNVVIGFSPVAAGAFGNQVVFDSNGGTSTNSVLGTGLALAQLVVSPATNNFGSVVIGQSSNLAFQVSNSGSVTLNGTASLVTGGSPFGIVSGASFTVAGGGSTNVVVGFSPVAAGAFGNQVVFDSNGGTRTNEVLGTGLALAQLAVSPLTNNFGSVVVGQSSNLTFQVSNTGSVTLNGTAALLTGGTPFGIVSGTSFTVAGGGTTNVVVGFSPLAAGAFGNQVVFASNGGTRTNSVLGTGLALAQLAVSPATNNYGSVVIGQSSNLAFQVSNTGSVTLNGTASLVTGGSPFGIVSGASFTVAGGSSTNVVVGFSPLAAGAFGNQVVFDSNGGTSTNDVLGTGLALAQLVVSPATNNFGSVVIGQSSNLAFQVSNSGSVTLNGTASLVTGGSPFGIVSGASFTVAAGGTTNVVIGFSPVAAGAFGNQVVFDSNGGTSTNSVLGTGLALAQLVVSPATNNFGSVVIGQSSNLAFQVSNSGSVTLNGTASLVTGGSPFGIVSGASFTVAGGGSTNVVVGFSPVAAGAFGNQVVFDSNGGTRTNEVLGTGLALAQLAVSPLTNNFGSVVVGQSSNLTFQVSNTGSVTLNGTAALLTGGTPFGIVSGTSFTVAGGGTTNVVVGFSPLAAGAFGNQVVFASNGGTRTNSVLGTGLALAQLAVSPATNNYGSVVIGQSSNLAFQVSNTGSVTLSGTASLVTGGSPFGIVSGASFTVAGGGTTNVVVGFNPVAAGAFGNQVVFDSNGGTRANEVLGTGLALAQLVVSPATNNYGSVVIGQSSNLAFQVSNTGSVTLNGTASLLSGGSPFGIISGASFTVAGGGTTNVVIGFSPVAAGAFGNQVVFDSNGGTRTNEVLGTGLSLAQLAVSPATNNYGSVVIGQSSNLAFQVSNSGSVTLSGTASLVTGGSPFGIVSGASFTVAGGGTTNVVVGFSPLAAGAFSNQVVFASNGGTRTNAVLGTGLSLAQLAVSPATNHYGSVVIGQSSNLAFQVSNTGSVTLSGTASLLSGGSPFGIVSGGSFTVAGGSATNVVVGFSPLAAGAFGNQVVFDSNGGTRTNEVLGTGLALAQLVVSPATNNYGSVVIGQSSNLAFQVSNTGSVTLNGTASLLSGGSPFGIISGASFTVAGGGTTNVVIGFSPVAAGAFGNQVVFDSNGGTRTNEVLGTGLSLAQLAVSPATNNYGSVVIGQSSNLAFQVSNAGSVTLSGSASLVTGGSPFGIVSGASFTVAGGSSTNVVVGFSPLAAGASGNQVVFDSNGGTRTNSVLGTGLALAQLAVSPLTNNFGSVVVGQSSNLTFQVSNTGSVTLNGTAALLTGGTPFGIVSGTSFTVAGGASTNVVIGFGPLAAGAFGNQVVFASNGGTRTNSVLGTGLALAQLAVSPATNNYGSVVIGQSSNLAFQVSNTGSVTLSGTASLLSGGSPFGIVSGASFTVAGGSSTNVVVGFSPLAAGAFGNQVVFASNGGTRTNSVLGTGLALAQLAVSPATNNFGSVVIGQSSNLAFQVSNTGSVTLSGTASLENGGNPFGIVSGTSFTVAGGASTNVVIGFGPLAAGAFGNQVVFAGNGGTRTNSVLGTGLASAQLAVSPATNNFGSVVIGQSSNLAFQVSNTGSVTLSGTASLLSGGSPFGIISGASFTVAGGGTTNVVIGFSPVAAGAFGNQVVFDSNGGTRTNEVLGTGLALAQLAVSPATNNFGSVVIGQTSNLAFQVSNTGSVTLSGTASLVTGGSPFGIVSGTSFTVAGGASTNVVIGFGPLAAGALSNQVVFASNGGTRTNAVLGTGLALAQLAVSPLTNHFGSVVVGQSSNLSFQVSNTGSVTLNGTAALLTGGTSFGIVSGTSFTVAGGASTNVVIGFGPLAAGALSNQVVFASNGGTRTNAVLGTGLALAQLAVSPATNNFGSVVIGQSSNLAFQVSNTGSVTLSATASLVTGGSPFGIVSGASFTVAGGASTNVVIGFSPVAAGAFGNQVVFASNGGTRTNAVLGTGLALAQLAVSPATNNYGSVVIGQSSNLAFQVSNSGSVTLSGTASLLSGGSPFGIISGASFTVAGGASTNVVIGFSPVAAGAFGNQVVFAGNGGTRTNAVLGTGLALAQLAVSPLTNHFGSVVVGQSSNLTFQVSNSGSVSLSGTASLLSGGSPFGIVSGTSFTVAGGASTNVVIGFVPLAAGALSNHVVFASNGGTRTNAVLGTGLALAQLAVSPATNNFGALAIGQSGNLAFQVSNAGSVTLNGTAALLSGGSPFGIVSGTPFTVPGGSSTNVVIGFSPVAAGAFSNRVAFVSNAGTRTNAVLGSGLAPGHIVVTPASVHFGYVLTGAMAEATLVMTNTGGVTVTNGTATANPPFNIQSGSPFTVAAYGSASVAVRFAPAAMGTCNSTVVINTANGGNTNVAVTGIGAIKPAACFSASPTNGIVSLPVTFTDCSSGTVTNRAWRFGDGDTSSAVNPSHTYTNAGSFMVSLTVFGPGGSNTLTRANYIAVSSSLTNQDVRDYIAAAKLQYFEQSGDGAPTLSATGFAFFAEVTATASNAVAGTTDQVPGGAVKMLISNTASNELSFSEYFTTAAGLDSGYSNGVYTLNIGTAHSGSLAPALSLAGDAYPNAPRILNYGAAQAINPTMDFTLSWTNFVGGTTNDFISLELEDAGNRLVVQSTNFALPGHWDGTATSFRIPAGSLATCSSYRGRLLFLKITARDSTSVPGAVGITGYGMQMSFQLNTVGGDLWVDASDLGNGWKWLEWFGYFNTTYEPWIYHNEHHWLYPCGADTSSVFFWDYTMQAWWWTSASGYPYCYRFSDSCWLWYEKDSVNPRRFYNITQAKWESW